MFTPGQRGGSLNESIPTHIVTVSLQTRTLLSYSVIEHYSSCLLINYFIPHFCPTARTKLSAPTMNVVPRPMMVDVERQSSRIGTHANLQKKWNSLLFCQQLSPTYPMYIKALIQCLRYLLTVRRKANFSTQCPITLLSRKNITTAVILGRVERLSQMDNDQWLAILHHNNPHNKTSPYATNE